MPTEGQVLLKTRDEIVQGMMDGLIARVPDAYVGDDGNLFLLFSVLGDAEEAVFVALQVVADDMFVVTASPAALDIHGQEKQVSRHVGTRSVGTLLFSGAGGTVIPINTEAAYDPGGGIDSLFFTTTEAVTIPDPGVPTAPTVAANAAAGLPNGTYEYAITFKTVAGETEIGAISAPVTVALKKIDISAIPVGGPGTIARRIYRSKNGGAYGFVHEIADNVTVVYQDNIADGGIGAAPPDTSTAERISAAAQSDDFGTQFNVLANMVTTLTSAPDGVTDVVNPAPFTAGTDEELSEDYRERLLKAIRNPGTGSLSDLESWALEVDGVETATAFDNTTTDANMLSANAASVEASIADWANFGNATLAQSATQALDGTKSLRLTAIANGDMGALSSAGPALPVTPGEFYSALAAFIAGTTARTILTGIQWRDVADAVISTQWGANYIQDSNAGWVQAPVAYLQAPPNATHACIVVYVVGAVTGEIHYVDRMLFAHGLQTTWVAGGAILTPAPGHVTIRISGPGGTIPSADVIAATLAHLRAKDIATVSLHVASFIADPIDVDAEITVSVGYDFADVEDTVSAAITAYINALDVGETFRLSGVISSVTSIVGVADVVITDPVVNDVTAATSKKTPGTITVTEA